ncbi:hypothetical protein BaRGS_00010147, partial [Batillaria attramentaria]
GSANEVCILQTRMSTGTALTRRPRTRCTPTPVLCVTSSSLHRQLQNRFSHVKAGDYHGAGDSRWASCIHSTISSCRPLWGPSSTTLS